MRLAKCGPAEGGPSGLRPISAGVLERVEHHHDEGRGGDQRQDGEHRVEARRGCVARLGGVALRGGLAAIASPPTPAAGVPR